MHTYIHTYIYTYSQLVGYALSAVSCIACTCNAVTHADCTRILRARCASVQGYAILGFCELVEEYFATHCGEDAVRRAFVQQCVRACGDVDMGQTDDDRTASSHVTETVKEWRVQAAVDVQMLIGTAPPEALRRLYGVLKVCMYVCVLFCW
jgi:hypothetical protein